MPNPYAFMRSMLFAPANRPKFVRNLSRSGADAGILDLEDGVAVAAKSDARDEARILIAEIAEADPGFQLFIRVNSPDSPWFEDDLAHALVPGLSGVVIPKVAHHEEVIRVADALANHGLEHVRILAGIETAAGVARVEEILAPPVALCYFGAEDFIADMGGVRTSESDEVLYARSRVVLAARMADVLALDQVVIEFRDAEKFATDAQVGRGLGYHGKICIHPAQVSLANTYFSPPPDVVERSRRLLDRYEEAAQQGLGVIEFEGQMVDGPLVRQALRAVAVASAIDGPE